MSIFNKKKASHPGRKKGENRPEDLDQDSPKESEAAPDARSDRAPKSFGSPEEVLSQKNSTKLSPEKRRELAKATLEKQREEGHCIIKRWKNLNS